ncbi:MAG: T9SS type A sorting domain-containing protein [Bacteroidia bacterium]|nr:T9SS type A sorting domain-containing protein [Bacteroidia bacterium]
MKIILANWLCLLLAVSGFAQSGSVAGGGNATGAGGSVSYSIGQTNYETDFGNDGSVTKGLQQPYEISIISGMDKVDILLTATIYPNPTASYITLDIADFELKKMTCELFTIQGVLIKKELLTKAQTDIDMAGLSEGTYLLKILSASNEIKTFKIIKNN